MVNELYMRRCLELAEIGNGNVSPNPMVGCVIVHENEIVGEGWHAKFGEAHAEVNAIKSVKDSFGINAERILKNSTVYVNLEPCAHFGKTPPCAALLIENQIKKIVIGNSDPFLDVNGKGIEKLRAAGIEIEQDVLEKECKHFNRRFFTRVEKQRPYVILKWAQTANGYFAPLTNLQQWISSPLAKKIAHKWRQEEDAILVGKKTVIADDPQLTSREWLGKNPLRLVIDKNLEIPTDKKIFNKDAKTIIFNEIKTEVQGNIHFIQMEDMQFYLPQKIAYQLYLMDIQSVIIEGGANIINQFIKTKIWDEARVFHAHLSWETGIYSPQINALVDEIIEINTDRLMVYQNTFQQ